MFGAAVDDGADGLAVFRKHGVSEATDILRGIFPEDLIYCRHVHPLSSGMYELQGVPIPLEHIDEEEFDAAIGYPHGCGGPFIVVFSVEKIVLKLLFGDFVGSLPAEIDKLPDRARIALLRTFAHTG